MSNFSISFFDATFYINIVFGLFDHLTFSSLGSILQQPFNSEKDNCPTILMRFKKDVSNNFNSIRLKDFIPDYIHYIELYFLKTYTKCLGLGYAFR